MTQGKKQFTHITWSDRITMEKMLREAAATGRRVTLAAMARRIGKTRQALSLELKRAPRFQRLNGETWTVEDCYSPELAQARYQAHLECKGGGLKIGNDMRLARFLEQKILHEKHSPAAALAKAREAEAANPGTFQTSSKAKPPCISISKRAICPIWRWVIFPTARSRRSAACCAVLPVLPKGPA